MSGIDFLFLNEQDMIDAGVLDMAKCIDEMEEVFRLLSKGDYRMGGKIGNSHGMVVTFPDNPEHQNMPKNGPDRRFCAMPGYLGGKYHLAGCKWYGSNLDNIEKHLPRSILMMMLNDPDTGAPLAYMSANLLSAWRTGAIPGVGARYLANKNSEVLGVLGAGSIGTSTSEAILIEAKNIKSVKIYDFVEETGKQLKERILKNYPNLKVELVSSVEEAVKNSDIVTIATSGDANPTIKNEWINKGTLFLASSTASFDSDFAINNMKLVVDNWKMYEEVTYEDEYPYNNLSMGVVGRLFLDWVHEGKLDKNTIINIGDVIEGKVKAREAEDDIIVLALGGQPVYDIAWAHHVYKNALDKSIGTKLNLWDVAYQAR